MSKKIAERIAEYVREAGGRTFYVGGFVRDRLLGIENKDVDIEVHGIEPDALPDILKKVGEPLTYGKSFGVFALKGEDIDIAMPRRERATGTGHRDFDVDVDPFIGTREAASRRDFTVNSMMEDVLTGEIVDHFGGRRDLDEGVIRHIDPETFIEDPLRVLRGAQFAARFSFTIAPDTVELCRGIDLSTLSGERVEEELKKALLKAEKPSIFFESLRSMDQLDVWFPELKQTIGLEQDPVFHPEGDVWTHTMEVIDRAAEFRDRVSEAYRFMLLALTHDLGKIVTTEEKNGRIHAYEHEVKGMPLVEAFTGRLTNEKVIKDYVFNMVPLHMRPNVLAYSKPVDVTDDEDGQLQQFYSCIGCDTVDMLEISIGGRKFDIIVDDEGRYKPLAIPSFSMPDGAVFFGNVLFAHRDAEGRTTGLSNDDLDILRRAVRESVKRLRPVWKSVLDRAAKS